MYNLAAMRVGFYVYFCKYRESIVNEHLLNGFFFLDAVCGGKTLQLLNM